MPVGPYLPPPSSLEAVKKILKTNFFAASLGKMVLPDER